jgi:hypothetical protein
VDQQLVEPCLETVEVAEARQLAPGREECLLDRVLGSVDVVQDAVRDGEETIGGAASEEPEGVLVAGSSRCHERSIHDPSLRVHPIWMLAT